MAYLSIFAQSELLHFYICLRIHIHFKQGKHPLHTCDCPPINIMLYLLHLLQLAVRVIEGAEKFMQNLVAVQQITALPPSLVCHHNRAIFLKINITGCSQII